MLGADLLDQFQAPHAGQVNVRQHRVVGHLGEQLQGLLVLRGGSWATRRNVIRLSFRNWDLAERRQIFSGFRCAEDG